MKEIYRSGDLGKVGLLADRLRAEGVEVFIRNENLSVTDAQIPDFFPAICVVNEAGGRDCFEVFEGVHGRGKASHGCGLEVWDSCGEAVPDSMSECWSCQTKRPAVAGVE